MKKSLAVFFILCFVIITVSTCLAVDSPDYSAENPISNEEYTEAVPEPVKIPVNSSDLQASSPSFSIESLKSSGSVLKKVPKSDFTLSVSVKNQSSSLSSASVIVAKYNKSGQFIGIDTLSVSSLAAGASADVSTAISNKSGNIYRISVFVVNSLSSPIPCGASVSITANDGYTPIT